MAPGGTVNTIARSLGADANPPILLERLVGEGRERLVGEDGARTEFDRPLLRVRSADGIDRVGMIFANGVGVRFLQMYYEDSGHGPLGAASVVARIVASSVVRGRLAREMFSAVATRVHVDGVALDLERFTAMVAGTVHHIGIGFRPFSMADRDPHRFHFAISEASSIQLVRELPGLGRGYVGPKSRVDHYCAGRVEMEFDHPELWSMDADIFPPTHQLVLEATDPIRFCVP
jgi:diacylglycerol kinase family enzyme